MLHEHSSQGVPPQCSNFPVSHPMTSKSGEPRWLPKKPRQPPPTCLAVPRTQPLGCSLLAVPPPYGSSLRVSVLLSPLPGPTFPQYTGAQPSHLPRTLFNRPFRSGAFSKHPIWNCRTHRSGLYNSPHLLLCGQCVFVGLSPPVEC